MRTRAAVAIEAGRPPEVMDVNLDGPKAGEVKITGLCHTDDFPLSDEDPESAFPAILRSRAGCHTVGIRPTG